MRTIFFTLALICSLLSSAQTSPILFIDNTPIKFQGDISLPYWVGAGKSIQLGQDAISASILEFTIVNNEMEFSQAIHLTNNSTVPSGKVWKIEAIGIGNNTSYSSINNFSNSNYPSIFNSPITFNTPGTYSWTVPPGVTNICIEAWGGGGGGGWGATSASSNGGGGGGGGYGYKCTDVTPGQVFTYTIASGGAGGQTSFGNILTSTNGMNGTSGNSNGQGQGGLGGTSNGSYVIQGLTGLNGSSSVTCSSGNLNQNGGNGGKGGGDGGAGGAGGNTCGNLTTKGQIGISPGGGGGGGQNNGNSLNAAAGLGASGQIKIYF